MRKEHKECAQKHERGWQEMVSTSKDAILRGSYSGLEAELAAVASQSFVRPEQIKDALLAGWDGAVEHFLSDGSLDIEEEKRLVAFAERHGFDQTDLDRKGTYTRFVQGAVLRELLEGKTTRRFHMKCDISFNFQKSESVVWGFSNVKYFEDKTRTQYVGGSHGMSFRIAKGVYYRVGGFKGRPVESTERAHVDTGVLVITTKHIYFGGGKKSFRIRLDKIVSFTPFSNGIGVQRDAASAKPQVFQTGDGWFIYNVLTNLAGSLS